MKTPFDMICRLTFWIAAMVGGWVIFRWFATLLDSYSVLAIFFIPFWSAGAYSIFDEIRRARGKGLRQRGILKDRSYD